MSADTPLLLLPGMMCDARLFSPQLDRFETERPVLVVDLTGADTVQQLAEQVLAQAPWPEFALAGLSMGGIVAMEVARQAPERVLGLALLNTNPWAESESVKIKRQPQIDAVLAGELLSVIEHQMAPKFSPDEEIPCDELPLVLAMAKDLGGDIFVRQSRALRDRPDQTDTLEKTGVPGLALVGEGDQLCPLDRHQAIADLMPDCELIVLPGVGHLTTLQAPEATNEALANWLERIK